MNPFEFLRIILQAYIYTLSTIINSWSYLLYSCIIGSGGGKEGTSSSLRLFPAYLRGPLAIDLSMPPCDTVGTGHGVTFGCS